MTVRASFPTFVIANDAYIKATLTIYTIDGNGAKTSTLATLYADATGSATLANPQTLDSEGKLAQPVYIEEAVIATVSDLSIADHDTGIFHPAGSWRSDWVTATIYYASEFVRAGGAADGTNDIYIVEQSHTSGTFATDVSAGKLTLAINVSDFDATGATLTALEALVSAKGNIIVATGVDAFSMITTTFYPKAFGAAADGDYMGGGTDDTAALQETIDAVPATGGAIDGMGLIYRVDSTLTLKSNLTIKNMYIDFTNAGDNNLFEATGVLGAVGSDLASDATAGDQTITVNNATGMSVGDYIRISSTQDWESSQNVKMSEWARIRSISVNDLTLEDQILHSYTTANTGTVDLLVPVENVVLQNVSATGDDSSAQQCGEFDMVLNFRLIGCLTDKFADRHFRFQRSLHLWVGQCRMRKASTPGLGYGVTFSQACCWFHMVDCVGEDLRHLFTTGGTTGVNRFFSARGNHVYGSRAAGIDAHRASEFYLFTENIIRAGVSAFGEDGMTSQGVNCQITNNIIIGSANHGIRHQSFCDITTRGLTVSIEGNHIWEAEGSGIIIDHNGAGAYESIRLLDNAVHDHGPGDSAYHIIARLGAGAIHSLHISNNTAKDVSGAGDYPLNLVTEGPAITHVKISDNTFIRSDDSDSSVFLHETGGGTINYISITGNSLENGDNGVETNSGDIDNIIITDNIFTGMSAAEVSLTGSPTAIIRDNLGYKTEASGTGVLSNGTTSEVITHGLDVTPSKKNVSIIGGEDPTNDVGSIWVDTFTSTQFTVNVENDPGSSNWAFGWQAIVL